MYTRCPNKHGELRDDFRCLNKLQRVFEKLKIVSLSKMWFTVFKIDGDFKQLNRAVGV